MWKQRKIVSTHFDLSYRKSKNLLMIRGKDYIYGMRNKTFSELLERIRLKEHYKAAV